MTRFLGTLVLICAITAIVGYYRGWFDIHSTNTNDQGTVNITVDKNKAAQDANAATQTVQNLGHK